MADPQEESAWRAEFERLGELLVYDNVKQGAIYNNEAKRQAAFRWLSGEAQARRDREVRIHQDTRRTFIAAVVAVIIGVFGIAVAISGIWVTAGH